MPIPKPKTNESKEDFTNRCMSNETMNSEYPDNSQRYVICMDSWRSKKQKKKYTHTISSSKQSEKGDWIVEAYATTTEVNNYNVQITRTALENAKSDFEEYTTVLFNHDQNQPVGRVINAEVDDIGLKLTIVISKTCEDLWNKINDKTISKMSIFGEYDTVNDSTYLKDINVIQVNKIHFYEASFVSVPGAVGAKIDDVYVASKKINNSDNMSEDIKHTLKEISNLPADEMKAAVHSFLDEMEEEEEMKDKLLDNLKILSGRLAGSDLELINQVISYVEYLKEKYKTKEEMETADNTCIDEHALSDEFNLTDKSDNRPLLQLTDSSEIQNEEANTFKKQILKIGTWFHNSAPGGILKVTKDMISKIVSNFNNHIIENVSVPLRHTDNPKDNTGNVIELVQTDNGLDAIIEVKDELVAEKIKKDLIRCISASIDPNYKVKTSGEFVGPTLLHAALVAEPYIKGMKPFVPLSDEFNGRPVYAFDDTEVKTNESMDSEENNNMLNNEENKNETVEENKVEKTEASTEENKTEKIEQSETDEIEENETSEKTEEKNETETEESTEEESVEESVEEKEQMEDVSLSDVNEMYESLLKEGKVVPAQKETFIQLFGNVKKTISLGDNEINLKDAVSAFFATQPKIVDFSENGTSETEAPTTEQTDEIPADVKQFYQDKFDLDDEGIKKAWGEVQKIQEAEKESKSSLFN